MKYTPLILATAASTLLAACATQPMDLTSSESVSVASTESAAEETATTEPAPAAAPRRTAGGHSKGAFFDKYDTDGDGLVSEAEFLAERENGYRRRDANQDGDVYSEEYVSEYETRLVKQLEDQHKRQIDQAEFRFTVLDKDEDGVLSLEEFHASGERMFSALDTNKDGVIDEADTTEQY